MKNFFTKIEKRVIGIIQLQPFFESLHRISIRGMNYMQSQDIDKTGEIGAMEYALSRHRIDQGKVLFDIGANNGQFVSYMVKTFPKDFQILSFEPSHQAFQVLKTNISDPNVEIFNNGFSNEKKEIKLYNSGSLIATQYPIGSKAQNSEIIKVDTLDDFCLKKSIKEIFYLKVDVEGAEYDVLSGAFNLIKNKKIHYIQFEYGPNCIESHVFLKDFFTLLKDYTIYRIVKNGLRKLIYNEIIEIPLTGNFLAELKPRQAN